MDCLIGSRCSIWLLSAAVIFLFIIVIIVVLYKKKVKDYQQVNDKLTESNDIAREKRDLVRQSALRIGEMFEKGVKRYRQNKLAVAVNDKENNDDETANQEQECLSCSALVEKNDEILLNQSTSKYCQFCESLRKRQAYFTKLANKEPELHPSGAGISQRKMGNELSDQQPPINSSIHVDQNRVAAAHVTPAPEPHAAITLEKKTEGVAVEPVVAEPAVVAEPVTPPLEVVETKPTESSGSVEAMEVEPVVAEPAVVAEPVTPPLEVVETKPTESSGSVEAMEVEPVVAEPAVVTEPVTPPLEVVETKPPESSGSAEAMAVEPAVAEPAVVAEPVTPPLEVVETKPPESSGSAEAMAVEPVVAEPAVVAEPVTPPLEVVETKPPESSGSAEAMAVEPVVAEPAVVAEPVTPPLEVVETKPTESSGSAKAMAVEPTERPSIATMEDKPVITITPAEEDTAVNTESAMVVETVEPATNHQQASTITPLPTLNENNTDGSEILTAQSAIGLSKRVGDNSGRDQRLPKKLKPMRATIKRA